MFKGGVPQTAACSTVRSKVTPGLGHVVEQAVARNAVCMR